MTKKIVYVAKDSGIDGREPESILYAAFDESQLDEMMKTDKARAWRRKDEMIVNIEVMRAAALAKLDGVDRLVLGLPAWPKRTLDA